MTENCPKTNEVSGSVNKVAARENRIGRNSVRAMQRITGFFFCVRDFVKADTRRIPSVAKTESHSPMSKTAIPFTATMSAAANGKDVKGSLSRRSKPAHCTKAVMIAARKMEADKPVRTEKSARNKRSNKLLMRLESGNRAVRRITAKASTEICMPESANRCETPARRK